MNNVMNIPQIEADQVRSGAQKARFTAYMQRIRKLEMKAQAENEKLNKDEIGGETI